jgi:hypothetical protein
MLLTELARAQLAFLLLSQSYLDGCGLNAIQPELFSPGSRGAAFLPALRSVTRERPDTYPLHRHTTTLPKYILQPLAILNINLSESENSCKSLIQYNVTSNPGN